MKEGPKLIQAASSNLLRKSLEHDVELAKSNIRRLGEIFTTLHRLPVEEPDHAFKIISAESKKLTKNIDQSPLSDSALIIVGSQFHHHKIALYGSLAALARVLKLGSAAGPLEQAVSDEKTAEETLTQLGLTAVNPDAIGVHNRPHDWPIV